MTQHTPDTEPRCAQVFKNGSRWAAHLYFNEGSHWPYWMYNYRTKARLEQAIRAVTDCPIERGIDE